MQLDAREEPVVRHASEVHLQMPSGFAQDDASTVAMPSRPPCPGRTSPDRLSRAQHKQTEAQITTQLATAPPPGAVARRRLVRSWMVISARSIGVWVHRPRPGDSRLPEKPSEDAAGTFTSRRASVRFHFRTQSAFPSTA